MGRENWQVCSLKGYSNLVWIRQGRLAIQDRMANVWCLEVDAHIVEECLRWELSILKSKGHLRWRYLVLDEVCLLGRHDLQDWDAWVDDSFESVFVLRIFKLSLLMKLLLNLVTRIVARRHPKKVALALNLKHLQHFDCNYSHITFAETTYFKPQYISCALVVGSHDSLVAFGHRILVSDKCLLFAHNQRFNDPIANLHGDWGHHWVGIYRKHKGSLDLLISRIKALTDEVSLY